MVCHAPTDLSPDELRECLSLITDGCAVDPGTAAAELPRAMLIVLAVQRDHPNIVGLGAIKGQRPRYASSIAIKSGVPFDKNIHELGYVVVHQLHRGLGLSHKITAALLSGFPERPLFATTSHEGMKRTLRQAGFVPQGSEWPGRKGNLSLWIKNVNSPNQGIPNNLKSAQS